MESFACMRGDTVNGFQCHTVWEVKGGTLQKPFMQDTVSLWGKSVSSSPGQQRICHSVNQKSHIVSSWTLRKSHYCFHYCTERRSNHQSSWLESGFLVPVTPRGASWSLKQGCMAYNHSLLYFKPYLSEGTYTISARIWCNSCGEIICMQLFQDILREWNRIRRTHRWKYGVIIWIMEFCVNESISSAERTCLLHIYFLSPAQLSATYDIFTSSPRRRGPPGLTAAVPPMTSEWYLVQLGLHLPSPGLPLQPQLDHFHPTRVQTHMCCSRPSIHPTNTGLFILEWATVFYTFLPHVWLWNKW